MLTPGQLKQFMTPFVDAQTGRLVWPTRLGFMGSLASRVVSERSVAFYEPRVGGSGQFSQEWTTTAPTTVSLSSDPSVALFRGSHTNALFIIPMGAIVAENVPGERADALQRHLSYVVNSPEIWVIKGVSPDPLFTEAAAILAYLGEPDMGPVPQTRPVATNVSAIDSVSVAFEIDPIRSVPEIGYFTDHPSSEPRSIALNASYDQGLPALYHYLLAAQLSPIAYVMSNAGTVVAVPLVLIADIEMVGPRPFSNLTEWNADPHPTVDLRYKVKKEWRGSPVIAVSTPVIPTGGKVTYIGGGYVPDYYPPQGKIPHFVTIADSRQPSITTTHKTLSHPMWADNLNRLSQSQMSHIREGYQQYVQSNEIPV